MVERSVPTPPSIQQAHGIELEPVPGRTELSGVGDLQVPYGPTEVYFTILGERLAILPAPISETPTTPTS